MKLLIHIIVSLVLVAGVGAFSLVSPEPLTYATTIIPLNISGNETYDTISYQVDGGIDTNVCQNCSSYGTVLNLSEGNHTILASASKDNLTFNDSVEFSIVLPDGTNETNGTNETPTTVSILSPENREYDSQFVTLEIEASETLNTLSYQLDNDTVIMMCISCSSYDAVLDLDEGNHTLKAIGNIGGETFNDTVDFSVFFNQTQDNSTQGNFSLSIVSPESIAYSGPVPLELAANLTLDTLSYQLDGGLIIIVCQNCSQYTGSLSPGIGSHTLVAFGDLGNETISDSVTFSVVVPVNDTPEDNETDDDETDGNETEPRFTLGLNKLPQAVADGQFTDSELAQLIRDNDLNPGIINRLIKTGKLGNESIGAIIDTQFDPPGIFKKLLGWFGFKAKTHSGLLYENYDLSPSNKKKLLTRDDLPEDYADDIIDDVREETRNVIAQQNRNKTKEKKQSSFVLGGDNSQSPQIQGGQGDPSDGSSLPPGQAKKASVSGGSAAPGQAKKTEGSSGKPAIAPGQAKKAESSSGTSAAPGQAKKSEVTTTSPGKSNSGKSGTAGSKSNSGGSSVSSSGSSGGGSSGGGSSSSGGSSGGGNSGGGKGGGSSAGASSSGGGSSGGGNSGGGNGGGNSGGNGGGKKG